MIDKDFIEIQRQIESLILSIDKATDNYDRKGFENNKVYSVIENMMGDLERARQTIYYMSKIPTVGHLVMNENGRYECPEADYTYTSGSRMEAYVKPDEDEESQWCIGRVEHDNDRGYYFMNNDGNNVFLHEGMKVRVR